MSPKPRKAKAAAAPETLGTSPAAALIQKLRAKLTKGSVRLLAEGSSSAVVETIPTGIEILDRHVLGCGGLPVGRMGEVFAGEGAGKSSLSYQFMAAAQRAGGAAIYIETENAFEPDRAKAFGCNPDEFILIEPSTLEETLDAVRETLSLIRGTGPNVLVWDSIASTPLKVEVEGEVGYSPTGAVARLMSAQLKVIMPEAMAARTALVFINQTREKIGVVFGDNTTTPGGNATKFYASWRLQLWRGGVVKKGETPIGQNVTVKAVKNKVAQPYNKAKLHLLYEGRFDDTAAILDLAKDRKLLAKDTKKSAAGLALARAALGWGDGVIPDDAESEADPDVHEEDEGSSDPLDGV